LFIGTHGIHESLRLCTFVQINKNTFWARRVFTPSIRRCPSLVATQRAFLLPLDCLSLLPGPCARSERRTRRLPPPWPSPARRMLWPPWAPATMATPSCGRFHLCRTPESRTSKKLSTQRASQSEINTRRLPCADSLPERDIAIPTRITVTVPKQASDRDEQRARKGPFSLSRFAKNRILPGGLGAEISAAVASEVSLCPLFQIILMGGGLGSGLGVEISAAGKTCAPPLWLSSLDFLHWYLLKGSALILSRLSKKQKNVFEQNGSCSHSNPRLCF